MSTIVVIATFFAGTFFGILVACIADACRDFGFVESNDDNGKFIFRFTFSRDPKEMLKYKRVTFRRLTNYDLKSLEFNPDPFSQKKPNT